MSKITPTSYRKPASGGNAKQLVIILHGWGADGYNLIDLAEIFSRVLPDAHFIAPNAPFICEANPFGFQWFSLMDRQPQHMLAGAGKAASLLNEFIDEQLAELSLKNDNLALVGFSQGTMTALHVALRRTPQIAAIVGFSGALIGTEVLAKEITARPPVCLIHGAMDEVVPYASLAHATEVLKNHGLNVEPHTRPFLGHSIDMDGMAIAAEFLQKSFGS